MYHTSLKMIIIFNIIFVIVIVFVLITLFIKLYIFKTLKYINYFKKIIITFNRIKLRMKIIME